MTIASAPFIPLNMFNGTKDGEDHIVLGFPIPGGDGVDKYIIDMTRMQYGEAGRGENGEPYYLGLTSSYLTSMSAICARLQIKWVTQQRLPNGTDKDNQARLEFCAQKAFFRWHNRHNERWCDYCGKGGSGLKRCGGCQSSQVFYCCKRHQAAGWKLHRHTCEKVKE